MGKVEVTLCIVLRFLTMVTRSRWLQLTIKICIFMVGGKITCIYFQPPWLWVANICPLSMLGFLRIIRNGWGSLLEKAQLHINSNLMLFPSQVQALQTNINLLNFIFIGEMSQGEREVITFSSGKQDFLDWDKNQSVSTKLAILDAWLGPAKVGVVYYESNKKPSLPQQ